MVFGEPVPSFSRTFSMVGRWPVRSRASAARSTSPAETPLEGGPNRLGALVGSGM